jgi:bacteriocin biosynthesis cyclodehydratase domain-containing protein
LKSYRALPAQLVKIDEGVVLVRGSAEIRIVGGRAEETVREVWSAAAETPVTLEDIVSRYAEPDRASVKELVEKLIARRILVDAALEGDRAGGGPESALEIFYWNFGVAEAVATASLNDRKLAILGANAISRRLASALAEAEITNFQVVDYVLARNQRLFGSDTTVTLRNWPQSCPPPVPYAAWMEESAAGEPDCIIATSDQGATSVLLEWNRHCLEHGVDFLPVTLRRLVGNIGPFVVPGETACYECLCARENSHLTDYGDLRAREKMAPYGEAVSGFFPSMGSILGDLAAMELVKFYSGRMLYKVGQLIEVSLLAPSLTSRKVLRVPRCRACAATAVTPERNLDRADFFPGGKHFEADKVHPAELLARRENAASAPAEGDT